ncbi:MAG: phosphonate ABC transporter ATP-binding protein [Candidatus Nitronauta litoralis]|uniref:Phosphonate ABC transporter ATP-binding protein n=1 Tax=Candidatus Nitronauta litoralis TaxID=2705533 RepID=A0A7T0BZC9_9BACT|nr:MAG: phosphonate ABC transporter ATP-binding protein [Candidatus Nitronauta litoralis]
MSEAQVVIKNVSKTFDNGGTQALKELSLEIQPGEFVVTLGPSGAGKSTLLRTLNRLIEPSTGHIWLDGEEVTGAPPARLRKIRHHIGMIFQEFNLIDRASVLTNVLAGCLGDTPALWSWVNHFSKENWRTAFDHLKRLGLEGFWDQRADRLSGGQRQRVGIARALMQKPKVLLADEPVASLDPSSARGILDHLKDINRQDGVTVICNLHQPELAREYAGRILGLRDGELIFDGPPGEFKDALLEQLYGAETAA